MLPLTARAAIPDGKIKVGILDSVAGPYAARVAAETVAEDFATEDRLDAEIHDHGSSPDGANTRCW